MASAATVHGIDVVDPKFALLDLSGVHTTQPDTPDYGLVNIEEAICRQMQDIHDAGTLTADFGTIDTLQVHWYMTTAAAAVTQRDLKGRQILQWDPPGDVIQPKRHYGDHMENTVRAWLGAAGSENYSLFQDVTFGIGEYAPHSGGFQSFQGRSTWDDDGGSTPDASIQLNYTWGYGFRDMDQLCMLAEGGYSQVQALYYWAGNKAYYAPAPISGGGNAVNYVPSTWTRRFLGDHFGDQVVMVDWDEDDADTGVPEHIAVHAAVRTSDDSLRILLIHKGGAGGESDAAQTVTVHVDTNGFEADSTVQVRRLTVPNITSNHDPGDNA